MNTKPIIHTIHGIGVAFQSSDKGSFPGGHYYRVPGFSEHFVYGHIDNAVLAARELIEENLDYFGLAFLEDA